MDAEVEMAKFREEKRILKDEIEALRKEYAIEMLLNWKNEEEKEDNSSIADVYVLATEEKKKQQQR